MSRQWFTSPKPPRLSEKHVISACLDLLRLRGYFAVRLHAGTFKSADNRRWIKGVEKGVPDYVCMRGPYGFLLELKRPGEIPSPEQARKHEELRAFFRLTVGVVDSVDALIAWLDQYERETHATQ